MQKAEIDPGCLPFVFFSCEGAVEILDAWVQFATDVGVDPDNVRVLVARVAVEEAVQSE